MRTEIVFASGARLVADAPPRAVAQHLAGDLFAERVDGFTEVRCDGALVFVNVAAVAYLRAVEVERPST